METMVKILSNSFASALGWALLHSVWQILFFALTYFLVSIISRNAILRYRVGILVMTLQFMTSLATFLWIYLNSSASSTGIYMNTKNLTLSFFSQFLIYFKQNLPLIVGLWIAGFLILSLKMLSGYIWMANLRNKSNSILNQNVATLFKNLKSKMGIEKDIELKTSTFIDIPLMMGNIKPVILLPVSLISGFSMNQIEIILAHELAHIKRKDYTVNLLQSFLDVVYFYHPVFWIISAQIRKEREICTDQLALQYAGDKVLLANTLLQLQDYKLTPSLALAFGKKQSAFSERIHRILGLKSSRNFPKESLWILLGLMITFFTVAQNNKTEKSAIASKSYSVAKSDTLKPMDISITISTDENNFTIKDKKLFFNGKEIELSLEKKEIIEQHLEVLEEQKIQMNIQSKLMEEQSKLMELESKKMSDWSKKLTQDLEPLQEYSKEITKLSTEISRKSEEFSRKTNKLNPDSKEFKKIQNQFESEVEILNSEIEKISEKMDEVAQNADLENADMERISKELDLKAVEMDKIAEPMDRLGKEMDKTIKTIIDLLPNEIKTKINTDFPNPPKAPKKPKYGKNAIAPPPPPPPPFVNPKEMIPPPPPPAPPVKH